MKTLHSLISEAELKRQFWAETAEDPEALSDRGVSKEHARRLESYFEGRYDGLCDAMRMLRASSAISSGIGATIV